jgi:STE24 endopeptidase
MWTVLLTLVIILGTAYSILVELLNLSRLEPGVPQEMAGLYDAERYRKSQEYLKINTRADLVRTSLSAAVLLAFVLFGGFDWADGVARSWGGPSSIRSGLAFAGLLSFLAFLFALPFRIHHTFVIEERFGFNRTTPLTFAVDLVKGAALGAIIGGLFFAGAQWFFEGAGSLAWLWCWIALTAGQLILTFVAPVLFLPLFNRFTPLPEGELRGAIERYARDQDFRLAGVFSMDGSKRSSKANAFFTGFGRFRRIVLFDTLIKAHPLGELMAVLAHEIGHYKCRHIPRQLLLAILSSGLTLWIFSFFVRSPAVFQAFRMTEPSVYGSLVLFSIAYAPVSRVISIYGLHLSRKYEFEADEYSVRTYSQPGALAEALKRLSVENLSNLKPHPLKVFMDYTHPPILQRLSNLLALSHEG